MAESNLENPVANIRIRNPDWDVGSRIRSGWSCAWNATGSGSRSGWGCSCADGEPGCKSASRARACDFGCDSDCDSWKWIISKVINLKKERRLMNSKKEKKLVRISFRIVFRNNIYKQNLVKLNRVHRNCWFWWQNRWFGLDSLKIIC